MIDMFIQINPSFLFVDGAVVIGIFLIASNFLSFG